MGRKPSNKFQAHRLKPDAEGVGDKSDARGAHVGRVFEALKAQFIPPNFEKEDEGDLRGSPDPPHVLDPGFGLLRAETGAELEDLEVLRFHERF